MAASSPALSNQSADNAPSPATAPAVPTATAAAFSSLPTTNASKNLRGLNKPKCIKCGNVARSRLSFVAECWPVKNAHVQKMKEAKMRILK
ncbi:hypothetical protein H5410_043169 [Solanum commersonii]|uniref:Uncharacterized protein n=1 Tax=Solanum commersonii TaxID=4109 RepID=A0A9J5XYG3_SOLCO|nr:hypothetical protein H5410_043169 [Solanum commersonii]